MAKISQQVKLRLSMAGEFGVASELLKRGYDASVTYGNAKAVDVICFDSAAQHYKTIEVKTTHNKTVVTGFFQKYGDRSLPHPDYWVVVYIDNNNISHFYILTHQEMGDLQMERNKMTSWQPCTGCDNVLISSLAAYENDWGKIVI